MENGNSRFKNFRRRVLAAVFSFGALLSIPGCADRASELKNEENPPAISETTATTTETTEKETTTKTTSVHVVDEKEGKGAVIYSNPDVSSEELYSVNETIHIRSDGSSYETGNSVECTVLDSNIIKDENGNEWIHVKINDNGATGYVMSKNFSPLCDDYSTYLGENLKDGESIPVEVISKEGESTEYLPKNTEWIYTESNYTDYGQPNEQRCYILGRETNRDSNVKDNYVYFINIDNRENQEFKIYKIDKKYLGSEKYIKSGIISSYEKDKEYELRYQDNRDYDYWMSAPDCFSDCTYSWSFNGDPVRCFHLSQSDGYPMCPLYIATNNDGKQYIVGSLYDELDDLSEATHFTKPGCKQNNPQYKKYIVTQDRNLRTSPGISNDKDNLTFKVKDENGNEQSVNILIPPGSNILVDESQAVLSSSNFCWYACTYEYNGQTVHGYVAQGIGPDGHTLVLQQCEEIEQSQTQGSVTQPSNNVNTRPSVDDRDDR